MFVSNRRMRTEKEVSMYKLEGKVAIVSGSAMGISRAVALRLAKEGIHIALFDLPDFKTGGISKELSSVIKEIEMFKVKVIALPTDVSDSENVRNSFNKVIKTFKKVDYVVNVAGIADSTCNFEEIDYQTLDKVYKVNVRGTFNMDKEATKGRKNN